MWTSASLCMFSMQTVNCLVSPKQECFVPFKYHWGKTRNKQTYKPHDIIVSISIKRAVKYLYLQERGPSRVLIHHYGMYGITTMGPSHRYVYSVSESHVTSYRHSFQQWTKTITNCTCTSVRWPNWPYRNGFPMTTPDSKSSALFVIRVFFFLSFCSSFFFLPNIEWTSGF